MAYLSSRIVLLTFLYFIQGLPYGLQARFLPVYLRSKGHSLTNLGFIKMLLAPWLCKALWAPLVDKYASKQKWLLWSITGLMATCAITSIIPPDNMILLCISIFSLNLFASTQDIAVDSIALTLLPPDELAKGNTAQVVGYKIGAIFGGGILVWFMDVLGWTGLFLCLTLLYVEALLFVYLSPTLRIYSRLERSKNKKEELQKVKGKQKLDAPADYIAEVLNSKNVPVELEKCTLTGTPEPEKSSQSEPPEVDPSKILDTSGTESQNEPEHQNVHSSIEDKTGDLPSMLKSALEFIETKDDFEKDLQRKHDLPVEQEVGAEKQAEIVQEIIGACPFIRKDSCQQEDMPNGGEPGDLPQDKEDKIRDSTEADTKGSKSGEVEEKESGDNSERVSENDQQDSRSQDDDSNDIENEAGEVTKSSVELGFLEDSDENEEPDNEEKEYINETEEFSAKRTRKNEDSNIELQDYDKSQDQGQDEEDDDDDVFLQEGEELTKESDQEDNFTCSSEKVSGRFAFLGEVIMVPNTRWIMVYVLIYKLGEQGALGMLPLFLVDQEVKAVDVTFWTGVIGQATSMLGSCLGGWILCHPVYKMPCRLLIYQLSLCRLLPLGLLLWVVLLWSGGVFSSTILYRGSIIAMNLLLLVSGMLSTATFTLMMECSQKAPPSVQATHYTLLSSLEVFGKLTFMSVCGALVDYFGYTTMYLSFVILSAALLPWLWRYPDILCEKKMS